MSYSNLLAPCVKSNGCKITINITADYTATVLFEFECQAAIQNVFAITGFYK
jgi:uncharacterized protein YfcZ (UPF0381/DUF406 family)